MHLVLQEYVTARFLSRYVLRSYIVPSNVEVLEEILDWRWPNGKELGQCRTDKMRVELFGVLRFREEADQSSDHDCPHAWDCTEPHVRYFIDWDMGKFIAENND